MRRALRTAVVGFLLALQAGAAARPDDASLADEARRAFARWDSAEALPDPSRVPTPGRLAEALRAEREARDAFLRAFRAVPDGAWSLPRDEAVVLAGLHLVAADAETAGDPAAAASAYERLLSAAPGAPSAPATRTRLVRALVRSGDLGRAADRAETLARSAPAPERPALLILLGDVHAAGRAFEKARDAFARAVAAFDALADAASREDDRARLDRDVALRRLVGTSPADVPVERWIGARGETPAASHGEVLVVRAGPVLGRADWDALEELARMRGGRKVRVLALTSWDAADDAPRDRLWIALPPAAEDADSESFETTRAAWPAHLETVRTRLRVDVPLGVVADGALARLVGARAPAFVVLDRDGVVVHASSGAAERFDRHVAAIAAAVAARAPAPR